jgi:hypothetical protein
MTGSIYIVSRYNSWLAILRGVPVRFDFGTSYTN